MSFPKKKTFLFIQKLSLTLFEMILCSVLEKGNFNKIFLNISIYFLSTCLCLILFVCMFKPAVEDS